MDVAVLTIFPQMFAQFWTHGIVRRAIEQGCLKGETIDIRAFAEDRHKVTDDRPYGGGCGMVMKPEPLAGAIREARERNPDALTLLMTPQGSPFSQQAAAGLARRTGLIFVCGRYEGVDERFFEQYVDDEISIGDYVLTGGELPAMVVIDAVVRLIPGVLGGHTSAACDSFADGLLEHGHYTRPRRFENLSVPDVLLSGNHAAIAQWRLEAALIRTFLKRPDLLTNRDFTAQEIAILRKWSQELENLIRVQSARCADSLPGHQ
ncbi:MAG: tRNA (guanosine(37)-N1)-methyltransferase TrmD [Desulfobacterales bacterium]